MPEVALAGTDGIQQDDQVSAASDKVPLLSFKSHMWDRFEFLWHHKVEPSRKLLEEFVQSLQDRAQLERHYARGLAKATARLEATAPPSGLPEAMEAVAVNMRNRSDQSLQLAEDLEADVCEVMAAMLRQHAEVSKRIFNDGRRLSEQWKQASRQYELSATRYAEACVAAESAPPFQDMAIAHVRKEERFKLCARMQLLQRQAIQAEQEYYQDIQQLNAAAATHERAMGNVLDTLQAMEEKRVRCFHDTAMKLAVYDVSWLRNMQYDLDAVVKTLENADGLQDLQDFIREHQTKQPPYVKVHPRAFWEFDVASNAIPAFAIPHRPEAEAQAKWRSEVVEPAVRAIFAGGDFIEMHEVLEELRSGFSTVVPTASDDNQDLANAKSSTGGSVARNIFCVVLEEELRQRINASHASSERQDLEALPPTSIPQASFDELVSLFSKALDGCDREGDCFSGRCLLAFLQLFHCSIDGKDVNILLRVYSHPLWSRVTFWEDVLMVGIYEAQASISSRRRSLGAGVKSDEVVMTTFLRRFVHFMVNFGIKIDQACHCVQKALRKHMSNLGQPLAEAYSRELTQNHYAIVPNAQSTALPNDPLPHITAAPTNLSSTLPAVSDVGNFSGTPSNGDTLEGTSSS